MNAATRLVCKALAIAVLTLACLEFTTRLMESNAVTEYERPLYENDPLLGYHLKAKNRTTVSRQKDGQPAYRVVYSIDDRGRRVTPGQDNKNASRFLLFFGCSVTFGEGVEDHQSLPFYVSQLAASHRVYNYGVPGYGPQHMLVKLQSAEITDEVGERADGILIYTFINDHIRRVTGGLQVFWGRDFPYYQLDKNDRLVRSGSFASGRPALTTWYDLLWHSSFVRYLNKTLQWPMINDDDIKLTARIIEESRNTFREKFHSDKFYVVIYPSNAGKTAEKLVSHLKQAGIQYFDYSTLRDSGVADRIPNDPHPSPQSYKAVASRLARDIGLSGQ